MGLNIIIPEEVKEELRKIIETGKKKFSDEGKIAIALMKKNEFETISLNVKNVDNGIVKIARENKDYIIATLDREIKSKIKNHKLTIRGNGKLEVI